MHPPEVWLKVTEAFDQAILLDGANRQEYLDRLAATEPLVYGELKSLLLFHDGDAGFLETPVVSQFARAFVESEPTEWPPGHVWGDFSIVRLLGEGSFAKVYLAEQRSLGRKVALKVSSLMGNEAQNMANLQHDHIVTVFSTAMDAPAEKFLICMQYVPGCTLEEALREAAHRQSALDGELLLKIASETALTEVAFDPSSLKDREKVGSLDAAGLLTWLGVRLANALEFAHHRGVLHLDIKPGNVLISPYGRPLLTDFNVSVRGTVLGKEGLSVAGGHLLGGTLNYMAPEHLAAFRGETASTVDERSDIYSLGTVLREMANQAGLSGAKAEALLYVLNKSTDKDPKNRYSSAVELSEALAGALEHQSLQASLPAAKGIGKTRLARPIWTLWILMTLPHLLGGVVNAAYNYSQIVLRLSSQQEEFFKTLLVYWNPFIYTLAFSLCVWMQREIYRFSKDTHQPQEKLRSVRECMVRFPVQLAWVTTLSWTAAALFFPVMLDIFLGPLESWVYVHFFISFLLSALIALAYSVLLSQYVLIRALYPNAWVGCGDIAMTARRELLPIRERTRLFQSLAALIPLFAALALIFVEPNGLQTGSYRLLLGLLIGVGMAGFVFTLRLGEQLGHALFALTGTDR